MLKLSRTIGSTDRQKQFRWHQSKIVANEFASPFYGLLSVTYIRVKGIVEIMFVETKSGRFINMNHVREIETRGNDGLLFSAQTHLLGHVSNFWTVFEKIHATIIPAHNICAVYCYVNQTEKRPIKEDLITQTFDVIGFRVLTDCVYPIVASEMDDELSRHLAVVQPDGRCLSVVCDYASIIHYQDAALARAQQQWDQEINRLS